MALEANALNGEIVIATIQMHSADDDHAREVKLLLVEDNEIDVIAFRRGLAKNRIANEMVVAGNGAEALQILRGEHASKKIESPYVVFLDLNMPIMNGIEFLAEVRQDDCLDLSIVFVLTTSDHEDDLLAAYRNHVAGYILKQNVGEACANLHELLSSHWRVVVLP